MALIIANLFLFILMPGTSKLACPIRSTAAHQICQLFEAEYIPMALVLCGPCYVTGFYKNPERA
jgi:hypothetical protein